MKRCVALSIVALLHAGVVMGCGAEPADVAAPRAADPIVETPDEETPTEVVAEEEAAIEDEGTSPDELVATVGFADTIAEYQETLAALDERIALGSGESSVRDQVSDLRQSLAALELLQASWEAAPEGTRGQLESEMDALAQKIDTALADLDASLGEDPT